MGLFDWHYLSNEQIRGLDNYKYSSKDTSPLSVYISHPFWDWLVKFYPTWLAPNVITLSGFCCVMFAFFLVSYFDYYLCANTLLSSKENVPNWIWLVCSICTCLGHHLDGTDGKQARRLGASGPTGELFDHGLDSWSTIPFTVTIFSVFGGGEFSVSPLRLLFILISVQMVFICTHWEKYNTGVLYLSWGYDASQYGLTFFYFLVFLTGHEYFKFYVFRDITLAVCIESVFYVCCCISLVVSAYNIYHAYRINHSGKQRDLYEVCLPMFPPLLLFILSVLWANFSPGMILERDPRLFLFTMGTAFSNIAMSSTRAETVNTCSIVYCAVVLLSIFQKSVEIELVLLRCLCVFITVAHLHFGICLVRQLCDHFKIQPFSLDYLKKR